MPCYGRPIRTLRAIRCIQRQTLEDFEAFVLGDGCPQFDTFISKSDTFFDKRFICWNFQNNLGGCGYHQTNCAIQEATGQYFMFMANDDTIAPSHMQSYLDGIVDTGLDFVYYDYLIYGKRMKTKVKYGRIGHSALIIRTDFLKQMPPHGPEYGHDYTLIQNMIKSGAKYRKGENIPSYRVMSGYRYREDPEGID